MYFVTICCQDRICRFGNVENGKMILNEYGQIAYNEWMKSAEIRTNIELGEFVVMPNHIHGIIQLFGRGELHSPKINNELHSPKTNNELHSPDNGGVCKTPLRSPSQTVGAIVRGYKSSVTKQLGLLGFNEKLWQRNYYEHIIRNEQSYQIISEYIKNNPAKWVDDKF
ncbi:MAG: transposase [Flavobacteriaceae bacterium]|nr:transposase [Flavobacteriaceae bacterium]